MSPNSDSILSQELSRRTVLKALFGAASAAVLFGLPTRAHAAEASKETTDKLNAAQAQLDEVQAQLDSIANEFSEPQFIDPLTFSVLCDAMQNDTRISAAIEFDFENQVASVYERSTEEWKAYDLADMSEAVFHAERKKGLSLETRRAIFEEALNGKEILFDETGEPFCADEDESAEMWM